MEFKRAEVKDGELFRELVSEYNRAYLRGEVKSDYFRQLQMYTFSENNGLIVAKENNLFQGLLEYLIIHGMGEISEDPRIYYHPNMYGPNGERVANIDLRKYKGFRKFPDNENIGFISRIEVFRNKRNGTGKGLVNALRKDERIKGIFLDALPNSIKFYSKIGFKDSGITIPFNELYMNVMVWNRDAKGF